MSKSKRKAKRGHGGGSQKGLRHASHGKKYVRFGIGLPGKLRQRLGKYARENKISMAGAAVQILEDRLG